MHCTNAFGQCCTFHLQVWIEGPYRYVQKKEMVLQQDKNRKFCVQGGGRYHKRDIMPDCILKLVRSWLLILQAWDYMGHRWG